jgi:phage terminase small subunit
MSIPESSKSLLKKLTARQKIFCRNYINDWNATRSYLVAFPDVKNDNVAGVNGNRLLRNAKIQDYIIEIQKDMEKLSGISKKMVLDEHKKMAFSDGSKLRDGWMKLKEFENLSQEDRACIQEVSTKEIKKTYAGITEVETWVKIKLYDKQKALDSISKMLGYDAPVKSEIEVKVLPPITGIKIIKDDSGDQAAVKTS